MAFTTEAATLWRTAVKISSALQRSIGRETLALLNAENA